jgi:hypothetical protein
MEDIKQREIIRKIYVDRSVTWFVQAMLEDSPLVSVSLGDKDSISIFYDFSIERDILEYLNLIRNFIIFEFGEKSLIIF